MQFLLGVLAVDWILVSPFKVLVSDQELFFDAKYFSWNQTYVEFATQVNFT